MLMMLMAMSYMSIIYGTRDMTPPGPETGPQTGGPGPQTGGPGGGPGPDPKIGQNWVPNRGVPGGVPGANFRHFFTIFGIFGISGSRAEKWPKLPKFVKIGEIPENCRNRSRDTVLSEKSRACPVKP